MTIAVRRGHRHPDTQGRAFRCPAPAAVRFVDWCRPKCPGSAALRAPRAGQKLDTCRVSHCRRQVQRSCRNVDELAGLSNVGSRVITVRTSRTHDTKAVADGRLAACSILCGARVALLCVVRWGRSTLTQQSPQPYHWRLTKHHGKAIADPELGNTPRFYLQLEKHLETQYPRLKNIRIIGLTATGVRDALSERQWYDVIFLADD